MTPEALVAELGEPELLETLPPGWAPAMAAFPAAGWPVFLEPREFLASRAWAGLDKQIDAPLKESAERIQRSPALSRLAWYYDWRIFETPFVAIGRWAGLERVLGDRAGLFYLLIALDMAPRLRRYHWMLGVPETVTRATGRQVRCFCGNYEQTHGGRPGILTKQIAWLRHYVRDNLYFRIGRLEFWERPYAAPFTVFRHRRSGRVAALANQGTVFNAQGYMGAGDKGADAGPTWTATLDFDDEAAVGYPIAPAGAAERRRIRLPFADWQCALCKDDPVLDMHIPADGPLGLEECGQSIREAFAFFGAHFPRRIPAATVCCSWIFSPCLEQCLPADSNLNRFLREMYLFPVAATGPNCLSFVFLFDKIFDPAAAPRATSLQRALLDYLAAGHVWRNGGMFFMADDLPAFGSQCYRANWPAI